MIKIGRKPPHKEEEIIAKNKERPVISDERPVRQHFTDTVLKRPAMKRRAFDPPFLDECPFKRIDMTGLVRIVPEKNKPDWQPGEGGKK